MTTTIFMKSHATTIVRKGSTAKVHRRHDRLLILAFVVF